MEPEQVAKRFHEAYYEKFGAKPWDDLPEDQRKLLTAAFGASQPQQTMSADTAYTLGFGIGLLRP